MRTIDLRESQSVWRTLTVVVLRTMFRAAALNGVPRTADVASIMSRSRMRPRQQMLDRPYTGVEKQTMLVCGARKEC